ncbi:regulator of chromosome condensation 1/beta-lactamase-inhibitor protein II [Amylocarpus encephaloides]|uniref:Regulator of chromosome condensation 1/beta-lactamase-inhibitor protein II n=1 Tax=Amylocarpus encephaloides TaxID=45428 RepID=A0A9P8C7S8_9HELO|nr:regulator of chromosome condensation 1/beta-lactamase-inhibitor protein II [Amylocarpus encephaloides]
MPPKKAAPAAKKAAEAPVAKRNPRTAKKPSPPPAKAEPVAKKTAASKVTKSSGKATAKITKSAAKPAVAKTTKVANTSAKRKAADDVEAEPASKRTKAEAASAKPAARKVAVAKKSAAKKVAATKAEPKKVAKKAAVPKAKGAPKPKADPKPKKPIKQLPTINEIPTQKLDVYVFGEGSAGELGLGAQNVNGKKVVDVTRPRLNTTHLSEATVGVVQIAVGGMHCAALTHDNRILTWGVNDQGALGRKTSSEDVKMKDAEDDDSDSDSDDEDSGLNPSEAEPREVDSIHFPEGTKFAAMFASDSSTFALTDTGLVYGWGTFRGNDGILGFRDNVKTADTPILIPELKKIVSMATGTNHVLALDSKGKCFAWGAGEQNQLGRRVVSRTATGALVPREFGLQKIPIAHIGAGDYHSFAVAKDGDVYSWGLNSFGQTGFDPEIDEEDEQGEDSTIANPQVVPALKGFKIEQIAGGAHHTIALTETGQVLLWGRIDNSQGGVDLKTVDKKALYIDKNDRPRFLIKPTVIPGIIGAAVATATDTCIAVSSSGQAYSWGFSGNYQTAQGSDEDVKTATLIDNGAVRGKKLTWCGVGGQFGMLAGPHVTPAA